MTLLGLVWQWQEGRQVQGAATGNEEREGVRVEVESAGRLAESGRFAGAKIRIDGAAFHGDVLVGAPDGVFGEFILQVVDAPGVPRLLKGEQFVPQIVLPIDAVTRTMCDMLHEGAGKVGGFTGVFGSGFTADREHLCASHIRSLAQHERIALFTRLQTERLERKARDLREVFDACERNWSETMYVALSQGMGTTNNKLAFGELARRVKFGYILRERHDLELVEALLLGTAGLLEVYDDDKYIRRLKAHFEHLRGKYSLVAMDAGAWRVGRGAPNNHPVLRIAQMANLLSNNDFTLDKMVACRTASDVHELLRAEASEYWSTHFVPSRESGERVKRLGHFMANTLGINIVATMIFAWGEYLGDESVREAAIELLEKLRCEENSIVSPWLAAGVRLESAFDSQAIIQLHNEWCLKGRCTECPVGRKMLKKCYLQTFK